MKKEKVYIADTPLIDEWDYEKNVGLDPTKITVGSNKIAHWKDKLGHEWPALICSRKAGNGCPYCGNRKLLKGFNDLATRYPDIAAEWHPTKNGSLTPNDVYPGSKTKVWWYNETCGHEWQASPVSRTSKKSGCPNCSHTRKTSFPEQAIYYYVKQIFPDAINSYKDIFPRSMELDIYIPSLSLGIEYDGATWHSNNKAKNREIKKEQICKKNNIKLIRIRESVETHKNTDVIVYFANSQNPLFIEEVLTWLFSYIKENVCYITKVPNINILRDKNQILSNFIVTKKEKSFEFLFPEIAREWDYERNGTLLPSMVTHGSNRKVFWICLKHNVSYEQVIYDRSRGKCACPLCKKENYKKALRAKVKRKPVLQVETKIVFSSITEASENTGVGRRNISACCTGRTKTAGGYHWQYA